MIPTCRSVDARVAALGPDVDAYHSSILLRCSEPALLGAVQTELRGDFRELPSRLAKRFPALESDFATYVTEQAPGTAWICYQYSILHASATEAHKGSDMALEAIAINSAMARVTGLPRCERIPVGFWPDAARDVLQRPLSCEKVKISEVRGGIVSCDVPVTIGIEELKLPLLQLGDKWIFFPSPLWPKNPWPQHW